MLRSRVHRHSNYYHKYPNSGEYLFSGTQIKSYILFFFELIPVMFQPQMWQFSLRPHIQPNVHNPQYRLTILCHTQNTLKISIFHSTLLQMLGKWTATTTGIEVLTGQRQNGSTRNTGPNITENIPDTNTQLRPQTAL